MSDNFVSLTICISLLAALRGLLLVKPVTLGILGSTSVIFEL